MRQTTTGVQSYFRIRYIFSRHFGGRSFGNAFAEDCPRFATATFWLRLADLADELSLLAETSENINRMGPEVQWCNLARIARTNYKHRVSGTTLQVRMYSRYIEVQLPAAIETVEVHRAWHQQEQAGESLQMRINKASWIQTDGGMIPLSPKNGRASTRDPLRCTWIG
jgi:hypothetical protein